MRGAWSSGTARPRYPRRFRLTNERSRGADERTSERRPRRTGPVGERKAARAEGGKKAERPPPSGQGREDRTTFVGPRAYLGRDEREIASSPSAAVRRRPSPSVIVRRRPLPPVAVCRCPSPSVTVRHRPSPSSTPSCLGFLVLPLPDSEPEPRSGPEPHCLRVGKSCGAYGIAGPKGIVCPSRVPILVPVPGVTSRIPVLLVTDQACVLTVRPDSKTRPCTTQRIHGWQEMGR